jgi:phage shock protein C
MQVNRRLYRCRHDQRIAGVASGVAEYFDVDPTVVRVLWVLSVLFWGVGLLLYIAMAIIVPLEPFEVPSGSPDAEGLTGEGAAAATGSSATWHSAPSTHRHASRGPGNGSLYAGIVFILFGALALIDGYLPGWADNGRFLWPAFVLGIGVLLVATAVRRQPTES